MFTQTSQYFLKTHKTEILLILLEIINHHSQSCLAIKNQLYFHPDNNAWQNDVASLREPPDLKYRVVIIILMSVTGDVNLTINPIKVLTLTKLQL